MRWLAGLMLLLGCTNTDPTPATLAGTWGLEAVNGQALPHAYVDTVPLPAGDTVFVPGTLVADTLVLRDGNPSQRRTWLGDPSPFTVGVTWSETGPGDSVTVIEVFTAGLVEHHGVLAGDELRILNVTLTRPGLYRYRRAP